MSHRFFLFKNGYTIDVPPKFLLKNGYTIDVPPVGLKSHKIFTKNRYAIDVPQKSHRPRAGFFKSIPIIY